MSHRFVARRCRLCGWRVSDLVKCKRGCVTEKSAKQAKDHKVLSILGATGSIGQSSLDVVRNQPDRFSIEALTGNRNIDQLARDAIEFNAKIAVTAD
ncbi:MAG TPA: hypothetical protein ENJ99_00955, partial [Rhizobiales bacterium]|nr:hypothetical protein [Hyphomicrobiales bacterium]